MEASDFRSVISHFRLKRNNKTQLLRYQIIRTKMLYHSPSPLNRPNVCLVFFKPIVLDHFTKLHNLTNLCLHNLTDLCYFISWLSLSMWDLSPRRLASISQIIIKEPPTCTSILTDLDHLIFTWYMLRLNWKLNYGMNRFTGSVSLALSYTCILRPTVRSCFGDSISIVIC